MLTDLAPDLLRPGAWVHVAQQALDTCSCATTPADVVGAFGSARALTEAVLGYPVSGGFATKPAIRAVGRLVTHRLGPALAAEALSWAASVIEVVDQTTIEALLDRAALAPCTYRPRLVEDREELHQLLGGERTPAQRRRLLLTTWDRQLDDADISFWWPEWERCFAFDTYVEYLLDHPIIGEPSAAQTARQLARTPSLFDLDDEVVSRCLLEATSLVLAHPACPVGLRERIRHPYDEATLELALRAGPAHVEPKRLERLLVRLEDGRLRDLAMRIPSQLLYALRRTGLLSAEQFLDGPLATVDLAEPAVVTAAFGGTKDWPEGRMPALLIQLLEEHPAAAGLEMMLRVASRGAIDDAVALRLAATADRALAQTALRHVDPGSLTTAHASLAMEASVDVQASCPGIAAIDRPTRPAWMLGLPPVDAPVPSVFAYPDELLALERRSFREASGWRVALPRTTRDLDRNALEMGNCTVMYADAISAGCAALLIVSAPDGRRYNVALWGASPRWRVGEINGRFNDGDEPAWLRTALTRALLPEPRSTARQLDTIRPPIGRRPTDRRDRRHRRATAARRRRR